MVDYGLKLEKTLKELRTLLHPTGAQSELVGTPGAGPSTIPAPTPNPEFVTPPVTQPDPLLQEPILEINTEELASLRSWAEAGPGILITPTTRTGTNIPVDLSTPGTVSHEHQRKQEEQKTRLVNPVAPRRKRKNCRSPLIPMKRSTRALIPPHSPIRANRKLLHSRSTGPLFGQHRRKSPPLAPSARRPGSKRGVAIVELIKGKEISSA